MSNQNAWDRLPTWQPDASPYPAAPAPDLSDDPALPMEERQRRAQARHVAARLEEVNAEGARLAAEQQAAATAAHAQQETDRQARLDAEMQATMRAAWHGTQAEFDAAWPELRAERLKQLALTGIDPARESQRAISGRW